jgi:hypothetical protein
LGAIDLYPSCLAFWICVATDAQRDALLADPAFAGRMRRIVADCGYPADSVDRVGFTSESDETVDRDWAGNWYTRHEVGLGPMRPAWPSSG